MSLGLILLIGYLVGWIFTYFFVLCMCCKEFEWDKDQGGLSIVFLPLVIATVWPGITVIIPFVAIPHAVYRLMRRKG